MIVELVPPHEKQPLQVIVSQKLAICLVAVLAPATSLAILSVSESSRLSEECSYLVAVPEEAALGALHQ